MKLVFLAELRRFLRDRTNAWLLAGLACVLLASAVSSGMAARAWRAGHDTAQAEWNARNAQAEALARKMPAGDQAMMATFQFARSASPPAVLPPLGGLALAPGAYALLAPDARVTVESRHTDHRRGETIANPLLGGLGVPDVAATLALLVPLAILGACAGLLQQLREAGLWRMVATQGPRAGGVLAAALAIRGGGIFGVAMAASALAFALDPGATSAALGAWTLVMLAYCTLWTGVAAVACSLPLSSGAAMLVAMAAWAATTFCIPAMLEAGMDGHAPVPSRLAAVAQVRAVQQDAEVRTPELLAQWYADHPRDLPPGRSGHTWPVSFLPRFLEQERNVRPIMAAFDEARAARFTAAGRWSFASPSLALAMVADELAGIDPGRFLSHMDAVNAYEDAWRAFFVPPVMRYSGVRADEFRRIPAFAPAADASQPRVGAARLSLF
ncbi:MAG TPA: DUF3526 domain-containing protein, partial [Ramlibacter sp.]|nr:DUF3526 domain-containing protein [Ramlibacter sp.]